MSIFKPEQIDKARAFIVQKAVAAAREVIEGQADNRQKDLILGLVGGAATVAFDAGVGFQKDISAPANDQSARPA